MSASAQPARIFVSLSHDDIERYRSYMEALRAAGADVAGRRVYRSPRIYATLPAQGIQCGRKRVACLMRAQGLQAGRLRKRKHTRPTVGTPSRSRPTCSRATSQPAPNRKWVAAITAIATRRGWLYLAGILDVSSRQAIGYAMDSSRDERLVAMALERALLSRRPHSGGWCTIRIAAASTPAPPTGTSWSATASC